MAEKKLDKQQEKEFEELLEHPDPTLSVQVAVVDGVSVS